jgi:hypothetical protein
MSSDRADHRLSRTLSVPWAFSLLPLSGQVATLNLKHDPDVTDPYEFSSEVHFNQVIPASPGKDKIRY